MSSMHYGIIINSDNLAEIGRTVTMNTLGSRVRAHFSRRSSKEFNLADVRIITFEEFTRLRRSAVQTWDPITLDDSSVRLNGLKDLLVAEWAYMDDFKSWEIRFHDMHGTPLVIWLTQRPSHCNLGRWSGHFEGLTGFDSAVEGFPRYYMDLDVGKREMREWAAWRVFKFNRTINPNADLNIIQGQ